MTGGVDRDRTDDLMNAIQMGRLLDLSVNCDLEAHSHASLLISGVCLYSETLQDRNTHIILE